MKEDDFIIDGPKEIEVDQKEEYGAERCAEQDHAFSKFPRKELEQGDHSQVGAAVEGNPRAHDGHPDQEVERYFLRGGKREMKEIAAQNADELIVDSTAQSIMPLATICGDCNCAPFNRVLL